MNHRTVISSLGLALLMLVGCGVGASDGASAPSEPAVASSERIQVAQATEGTAPAPTAVGGAIISGQVALKGAAPQAQKLKMDADPVCLSQHGEPVAAQEVVVNANNTLRYVFVYVKDGVTGTYPAPKEPAVIDQQGCLYAPHVLGVQTGQPVEIRNDDGTLHNINVKPANNPPFNVAQPVKGMKTTKTFANPEVMIKAKCNVHPWMAAYIGVVAHPFFAVTDEQGNYTIKGLPAGTYTLEAWHEKFGTQTQQVQVVENGSTTVNFEFAGQ